MDRQDVDQGQSRNRLLVILFIAFALLQAADIFTTNLGLSLPGVDESNPVVAHIMHHLGSVWWLPKFMVIALALMGTRHPRPSMLMPAYSIAVAVSLFTVANNILFFQLR